MNIIQPEVRELFPFSLNGDKFQDWLRSTKFAKRDGIVEGGEGLDVDVAVVNEEDYEEDQGDQEHHHQKDDLWLNVIYEAKHCRIFQVQTGICLNLVGSKPLPGWFGALMQWKLKLKWAFACVKEGVKACQDALCTYVPSKRWFGKFAQIGPEKKCPRVPVWVRVGGSNRYLGNAQIEVPLIGMGLPLSLSECL